jgi:hypothetical protein
MAISKFVPADLSKTAYFTLRRHATERHHAAPSSQSRWTTAERTMTPAEASLKGVDRPPAIKERATNELRLRGVHVAPYSPKLTPSPPN